MTSDAPLRTFNSASAFPAKQPPLGNCYAVASREIARKIQRKREHADDGDERRDEHQPGEFPRASLSPIYMHLTAGRTAVRSVLMVHGEGVIRSRQVLATCFPGQKFGKQFACKSLN